MTVKVKIQKQSKGKKLRKHYTNICWYSGVIFESNRRTAKFKPGGNRQLFHKYGSRINPMVFNLYGELINADDRLGAFYDERALWEDGWSIHLPHEVLFDEFDYTGPLPERDELMVVGSYVIKRIENLSNCYSVDFCVKPIFLLTVDERATMTFVKGEITKFETHDYVSPEQLAEVGIVETKTVEEQKRKEEESRRPIEAYVFRGVNLKNFQRKPVAEPLLQNDLSSAIQGIAKVVALWQNTTNGGIKLKR